ncbi:MAG: hypothetical protein KIT34_14710 [Cyanobacteria bacterium TGS_CYA1]|nr:hypothetical protein [Cyanobacteria bacterium TGS_CYA1]
MKLSSCLLLPVLALSFSVCTVDANAQLPPTTWSKTVHTPGDNQYGGEQQGMRHPVNNIPINPNLRSSGPAPSVSTSYQKAPSAPKPDISLQPIPADEPIVPSDFPPLPTGLDLPGVMATTAGTFSSSYGGSRGGGGGGGGAPSFQGKKQGYGHFAPGAFEKGGGGGGGGGYSDSGDDESWKDEVRKPFGKSVEMQQGYGRVAPGAYVKNQSPGYYKAREAPLGGKSIPDGRGADTFGANDAPSAPSAPNFKGLGREPRLQDDVYGSGGPATPSAPVPVSLSQASTQDLSLPDDDFIKRKPPSRGSRYAGRMMNQMMRKGMMQGMRMMRF